MRAFYRVLPGAFSSSLLLRTETFLGPAVDNRRIFAVFKTEQCAFEFRLTSKPVLTLSAGPKPGLRRMNDVCVPFAAA